MWKEWEETLRNGEGVGSSPVGRWNEWEGNPSRWGEKEGTGNPSGVLGDE